MSASQHQQDHQPFESEANVVTSSQESSTFVSICTIDGSVWAVDSSGALLTTTKGSATWSPISIQGNTAPLTQVSASGPSNVWVRDTAGTIYFVNQGRLKAVSGGSHWMSVAGDGSVLSLDASGQCARLPEGAVNWQPLPPSPQGGLSCVSQGQGIAVCALAASGEAIYR
ncbi:MAG TPA: hypothetical protein VGD98_12485 [Ktedonobacteraceae bacterium]